MSRKPRRPTHTDEAKPSGATPMRRKSSKVLQKLHTEDLRSVKSHTELAETANGVRMLAKNLSRATIQLDVRVIMIVTKARDNSLIYLTREVVEWCFSRDNDRVVYVDHHLEHSKRFNAPEIRETYPKAQTLLRFWDRKFAARHPEVFDLVVTLGGDGTVLYVSNLFQRIVPPVMSFSLGSLGFLTNFKFQQFRERMHTVIDTGVKAYLRMRFTCRVHKADGKLVCEQQVLNELVVDRGPSPFVTNLELYGDGALLTVAQADGLIIATPTGSTAYSLSAGGSLVHPSVPAISVTPICPHTLSFRPILLPDGMFLKVKVPTTSRSTAWASFDGKVRTELAKGDYVTIQASPYPFPTVSSSRTEYFDSVSRNLNWNAREQQKPFSLLSDDNRRRYRRKKSARTTEDEEEEFDIDGEEIEKGVPKGVHGDVHKVDGSDEDSSDSDGFEIFDLNLNDDMYLPLGEGTQTPPANAVLSEDRTCWAHPNATISLAGIHEGSHESHGPDRMHISPHETRLPNDRYPSGGEIQTLTSRSGESLGNRSGGENHNINLRMTSSGDFRALGHRSAENSLTRINSRGENHLNRVSSGEHSLTRINSRGESHLNRVNSIGENHSTRIERGEKMNSMPENSPSGKSTESLDRLTRSHRDVLRSQSR